MIHHLKLWPRYFARVASGHKTLEVRHEHDRHFEPGDALVLEEFDPAHQRYTGRTCHRPVTDVLRDPHNQWLQPHVAALSIPAPVSDEGLAFTRMQADATERLRCQEPSTDILSSVRPGPTFIAWPQTWPNPATGFGGFAGQAITTAPTFVWSAVHTPIVVIYHQFRWAYTLTQPNARFTAACHAHDLPGATDTAAIAALDDALTQGDST